MRNIVCETYRQDERGAALTELAIAVPIVLLLFIGIIDFSRAMWCYNTLEHASREVVRFAAVHSEDSGDPITVSDLADYAKARAAGLNPDSITVVADYTPSNTQGAIVEVKLIYQFKPVVPFMPDSLKRLVGSAQMRVTY